MYAHIYRRGWHNENCMYYFYRYYTVYEDATKKKYKFTIYRKYVEIIKLA